MLALLAEGPKCIAALTDGLAEAELHTGPSEGEWSANDVLAHLRSCADMWGSYIRTILAEDHPTLRAVSPRTWIKTTDYPELEFRPSLHAFTMQRADLLEVLEALPPDAWSRKATVKGVGKVFTRTVYTYGQWLANHEKEHVKQIARIAETMRL